VTLGKILTAVEGMTPEQLFHSLLGLGTQWRVMRCDYDHGEGQGVVRLWVEETRALWDGESSLAGELVTAYDHTEELVWRHLNVFEHRCEIRCRLPRGRKTTAGQVYRVLPPWEGLSKHFTQAFEAMALLLMRQMPVAAVGRHVGETDTRLWRMLKAHVALAHPRVDWSGVVCVGCDEMSVRKGHHYISVFCDLIGKRVLFATPGKDKRVWESFVAAMSEHNGHPRAITEVSIDMSPAYVAGVKENLGDQAAIVFDKFHVIAHVNEAVDETRRAERRLAGKSDADLLKDSRWVLLKNPANHTLKQAALYQGLLKTNLAAVKAHQMRLALQDIYQIADPKRADRKLRAWCRWVRWIHGKNLRPLFADMLKCAQMIERHLAGILAHWVRRTTNAFLEGLNSVFSAVKRKARGFRSIDNLITMLYFTAGQLDLPVTHWN
jgi:transposase